MICMREHQVFAKRSHVRFLTYDKKTHSDDFKYFLPCKWQEQCFNLSLFIQTERIEMVIVHTDWYLYDCPYQRDLMVVALYIVQNMAPVAVADIIPLNYETGVMVE